MEKLVILALIAIIITATVFSMPRVAEFIGNIPYMTANWFAVLHIGYIIVATAIAGYACSNLLKLEPIRYYVSNKSDEIAVVKYEKGLFKTDKYDVLLPGKQIIVKAVRGSIVVGGDGVNVTEQKQ